MSVPVVVQDQNGKDLAITSKGGLVRILLRNKKARSVKVEEGKSFTIRLLVDEKFKW